MPYYLLYQILNYFILFPAIAGAIRCKYIWREFYPFLLLIWIGACNEIISDSVAHSAGSNALNGNIYILIEYLLILYLFYTWNGLEIRKYVFFGAAGIIVWMADNFIINSLTDNNSIFRIFYSIVLLGFSIDRFGKILVFERKQLLRNAQFLICAAFVIYYFCKMFVELFNAFRLPFDKYFYMHLWIGLSIVNCIANIIFGIAIICIRKKPEFIMPY